MAIDTVTPPVPDLVSVDSVLVMVDSGPDVVSVKKVLDTGSLSLSVDSVLVMVDSDPDVVSVKMVLDTGSLSLSVTVIQSDIIYMLYTNTVTAKLKGSLLIFGTNS